MNKTVSKIIAVFLALSVMFTLPAFVSAEDVFADISGAKITATSGTWNSDYAGNLEITLDGNFSSVGDNDVLVVISVNSTDNITKEIKKSDADVSISSDKITIEFAYDGTLSHSDKYYFEIPEGAFKTSDEKINASYTFEILGNLIIETIPRDKVAVTPIQRLILAMENSKYAKYLWIVIVALKFFDSL